MSLELRGVRKLLLHQPELSVISVALIEMLPQPEFPWMERWLVVRDANHDRVIAFECQDFDARVDE